MFRSTGEHQIGQGQSVVEQTDGLTGQKTHAHTRTRTETSFNKQIEKNVCIYAYILKLPHEEGGGGEEDREREREELRNRQPKICVHVYQFHTCVHGFHHAPQINQNSIFSDNLA